MITIKLSAESGRTIEKLKSLPNTLRKALVLSVDQGALEIQNRSKELAPYKTGNLRRSITKSLIPASGGLSQRIGTDVVYAAIHEFGGVTGRGHRTRIKARPYFRPAIKEKTPKIKQIFEKNIANAVK